MMAGNFQVPRKNVAIVASRFNDLIVDRLIVGANDVLLRHGMNADNIELIRVPGAFEIPLVCQSLAKTNRFSGIIALGAIIRGETPHFDFVASASAQGILQTQLQTQIPITFGILTTDTMDQALARAGSKAGNKGTDAAMALLEVMDLLGKIHE